MSSKRIPLALRRKMRSKDYSQNEGNSRHGVKKSKEVIEQEKKEKEKLRFREYKNKKDLEKISLGGIVENEDIKEAEDQLEFEMCLNYLKSKGYSCMHMHTQKEVIEYYFKILNDLQSPKDNMSENYSDREFSEGEEYEEEDEEQYIDDENDDENEEMQSSSTSKRANKFIY